MTDIEFRDPSVPARNRGAGVHFDAAKKLRENPGKWAIIGRYKNSQSAASIAYQIRIGGMAAYEPAGAYDAVARTEEGQRRVYARYLADPEGGEGS